LKCLSDRGAFTHSSSRPTRDIGRPLLRTYVTGTYVTLAWSTVHRMSIV
jgi:hypothetical protein